MDKEPIEHKEEQLIMPTTPQKQRVMFISSKDVATDFKNRCVDLADDIEIATLGKFGSKPAAETFGKIEKIMKLGALEWTIFHLPSVNETFGATVFFEELKGLIKRNAVKRAHTAIIDEDELYKQEVRNLLLEAGVQVVSDPNDLGMPFSRMLTSEEYAYRLAGEQNPAFADLSDYSDDDGRLPGMSDTTPSSLENVSSDPFSEFEEAVVDDPFSGDASGEDDPFAIADAGMGATPSNASQPAAATQDPFAQGAAASAAGVVDDFAGFEVGSGGISGEFDDDALFEMLEQDINGGGTSNADPFAGSANSLDNVPTGDEVFAQGDPFAGVVGDMFDGQGATSAPSGGGQTQVDVGDLIGGVGGVMSGSSVADDVVGAGQQAPQADPFANFEDADGVKEPSSASQGGAPAVQDPFAVDADLLADDDLLLVNSDPYDDGDLFSDGGNYDTGMGADSYGVDGHGDDAYADPYDDGMGYRDDPYAGDGQMQPVGNPQELAHLLTQPEVSLSDILDAIGPKLSDSDYSKMATMCEPIWDYSMEHADGIGQKGLFGKKSKGALSSSAEDELASSIYISDMEAREGYYMPPNDAKVILVNSFKGGSGKLLADRTPIWREGKDGAIERVCVGDIVPGDKVFARSGNLVEVLEVHPQEDPETVHVITFEDGRKIECSADHLWNVLDESSGECRKRVLSTSQIMDRASADSSLCDLRIPLCDPMRFPEDPSLPNDLRSAGETFGKPHVGDRGTTSMDGGVFPDEVMSASASQRLSFAEGLVSSCGHENGNSVVLSPAAIEHSDRITWLFRSLGCKCSFSFGEAGEMTFEVAGLNRARKLVAEADRASAADGKETTEGTEALPMSPYLLGALLACDAGANDAVAFPAGDPYIASRIIGELPSGLVLIPAGKDIDGDGTVDAVGELILVHEGADGVMQPVTKASLHDALHALIDRKMPAGSECRWSVPETYLHASREDRLALLQGLCDIGCEMPDGTAGKMILRAQVPSGQLIELIEGLGYNGAVGDGERLCGGIEILSDDIEIFSSSIVRERMMNVMGAFAALTDKSAYLAIESVEMIDEKVPMTCLLVDDDEHLFVAGDAIVTHNTTVSVGLASQLNWYFNQKLMQRLSATYNVRVLIFSLNEFDDISVHGVGYETAFSQENDTDGRNVAELLRKIDETGGKPQWDEIKHCFVSTERNRVFYLPSMTTREVLDNDIIITAEDYKKVIECCKQFFQFIIIDSPDVFYTHRADVMNFAFAVADIICMIIEPDTRSTVNLMHFFDGLKSASGRIPLSPDKCLLVVNKVVTSGNPYLTVPPVDQIKFERITKMLVDRYARFVAIPFTQPRGTGNILFGTDKHVKLAFAELADDVLEMIDANDAREEQKRIAKARR